MEHILKFTSMEVYLKGQICRTPTRLLLDRNYCLLLGMLAKCYLAWWKSTGSTDEDNGNLLGVLMVLVFYSPSSPRRSVGTAASSLTSCCTRGRPRAWRSTWPSCRTPSRRASQTQTQTPGRSPESEC